MSTNTLSGTGLFPSTTITPASTPTEIAGDSKYELLGCYTEAQMSISAQAASTTTTYIKPIFSSPEVLTVPLCLESCAVAQPPNGGGSYAYTALENSRECYCSTTLSNSPIPLDPINCASPCVGAPDTLCGGQGYLSVYRLRINETIIDWLSANGTVVSEPATTSTTYPGTTSSSIELPMTATTSSSSTTFSTTEVTSTPNPTQIQLPRTTHHRNLLPLWIILPILIVILLLFALIFCLLRRRSRHKRHNSLIEDEVAATATMEPHSITIAKSPTSTEPQYEKTKTKMEQLVPVGVRRTLSGRAGEDGRRFGNVGGIDRVVELGRTSEDVLPTIGDGDKEGLVVGNQGHEIMRKKSPRRDTIDAWKTGLVPTPRTP